MAVGQGALISAYSYFAVGRETTTGTYNTATAALDFMSSTLKTTKDSKILEEISRKRTYAERISLGKVCEGEVEHYFRPDVTSNAYFLQNAFGGTVTSATVTAASSFTHTFEVGGMDQSWGSMCINMRKGDSTNGKVWEYSGVRVNEYTLSAELDDALMCSMALIAYDSTQTSNDVESALTMSCAQPLNFDNGRFSIENSFGSLTSSSFWHVQTMEFKIANSLKSDTDSRRIGSDILQVLPPGIQSYELSVEMRFDTTTAYDAMINATRIYGEFEFLGTTLSGSSVRRGINFVFPKLYIKEAGDPEVGGPDEIIKSTVVFDVLRDCSSATGYACQAILTNGISSY